MNVSDMVFVGIKGSVIALDRATGQQVWATHLKGSDFVNVVLDDDVILATTYGEIFCLNAANGTGLWHNKLKGLGMGLSTIATSAGSATGGTLMGNAEAIREEERRRRAAAASG